MTSNILCLILARGGSIHIPGKNIKLLGGKPLLAYTIECAKACKHPMRIVVSTDDPLIASVAEACGAETIPRPAAISQSDSLEIDAFKHTAAAPQPDLMECHTARSVCDEYCRYQQRIVQRVKPGFCIIKDEPVTAAPKESEKP